MRTEKPINETVSAGTLKTAQDQGSSEIKYLNRQNGAARHALRRTVADLRVDAKRCTDARIWLRQYPWQIFGAAAIAAGLAVAHYSLRRRSSPGADDAPRPARPSWIRSELERGVALGGRLLRRAIVGFIVGAVSAKASSAALADEHHASVGDPID